MGRGLLLTVSGLIIITSIIQLNIRRANSVAPARNAEYFKAQQARNLTSSLIDNAVEKLKRDNNWTGSIQSDGNLPGAGTLWTFNESSSQFPNGISVDNWDEYQVLLYSESTFEDITIATEVLLRRDSFSKFSYFTESEISAQGSDIFFFSQDELSGPIHTNEFFKIAGSPTFNGLVTAPEEYHAHSSFGADPNFLGGTNFNAPTRPTPTSYEIGKLTTAASSGGLTYTNAIEVEFFTEQSFGNTVGKVLISEYNRRGRLVGSPVELNLSSFNGIISSSKEITTKGTVAGRVTLHSEQKVTISGDIEYADDPRSNPGSNDLLGIVSEGDVEIDVNAHLDNGTTDLNLQASILALGSSFTVENYQFGLRGDLNLLGGLVQRHRGPVGTFGGSGAVSGYLKNYEYDTRLASSVPPAFPRESVFSIVYWKDKDIESTNSQVSAGI